MEDEELMELPYGKAFKKCWDSYIEFIRDNKGDYSNKSQNWVLNQYLNKRYDNQEAIKRVLASKEILKDLIKKGFYKDKLL